MSTTRAWMRSNERSGKHVNANVMPKDLNIRRVDRIEETRLEIGDGHPSVPANAV